MINHTETWLRQRGKAPCDFYQALLPLRSYAGVTGSAASHENGLDLSSGGKGLGQASKSHSVIWVVGHDLLLPIRPGADAGRQHLY